jgi:CelD/BcsL family acetyltransferase involved in cellulose biosynthesis
LWLDVIGSVRRSMQISVARPNEIGPSEIVAWHSMQRKTQNLANPFLSPEYAAAVGRFREDARVAVLSDGAETVGFFPFERRRFGVGMPIGAGVSNCQGLIHAPSVEWDPHEVLRACRIAVWQFDNLAEGQKPFERYATAVTPSAGVDLTEGFGAYQKKLQVKSARFCRNIRRNVRNLEREVGELRFVVDARDMAHLRTMMRWKSEQYRRSGLVDVFDRPWIVELVDSLFSIHSRAFAGLLSVLYAGEIPIAVQFGLQSGSVFVGWFTAYDSRFGKYSPGIIQLIRLAEDLAELGVHTMDLGAAAGFKEALKSHDIFSSSGMAARGPLLAAVHRTRIASVDLTRRQVRRYPPLYRAADQLLRHYGRVALVVSYLSCPLIGMVAELAALERSV